MAEFRNVSTPLAQRFKQAYGWLAPIVSVDRVPVAAGNDRVGPLYQDRIFWAILLIAFVLRLYVVLTTSYIWDENRDWILAANSISFDPDNLHLPIRALFHGALGAYFIKFGTFVFGENPLGYRICSVVAGIGTIAVVAVNAKMIGGRSAALWAAVLLAFNEFHIFVSVVAIQLVFSLFFLSLATLAFTIAIERNAPKWLYPAALCTGVGFLCYELLFLLAPIFAAVVLYSKRRVWLGRIEPYIATVLCLLVIAPDLAWNFFHSEGGSRSYSDYLNRLTALDVNPLYLLFFFHDIFKHGYAFLGRYLPDNAPEYASMNFVFGSMLFGSAVLWTLSAAMNKAVSKSIVIQFYLIYFWLILLFFTFIGTSKGGVFDDSYQWFWLIPTIIPGVMLCAFWLSNCPKGTRRIFVIGVVVVASLISLRKTLIYNLDIQPYNLIAVPEMMNVSENNQYDVRITYAACMLCDPAPRMELTEFRVRADGQRLDSETAAQYVTGVTYDDDNVAFTLRSPDVSQFTKDTEWEYEFLYDIHEASGRTHKRSAFVWVYSPELDLSLYVFR